MRAPAVRRARARPSPREAPVTIPVGMVPPYEPCGPRRYRELVLGPVARRVQRRLRAVGDAELPEHVADVRLHRLFRDAELEGDALVREAARDQVEYLALACRQVLVAVGGSLVAEPLHQPRGHR